jgi:hypothetical protein
MRIRIEKAATSTQPQGGLVQFLVEERLFRAAQEA